jgi:hypothetical protein
METSWHEARDLFRVLLEDTLGMGRYEIATRYKGGKLLIQPADPSLKAKEIPMDTFWKKVTAVREKLRVLEQKINNNDNLSLEEKAELQGLISRAYGSLTTFNVLFKDEDDHFQGTGGR